MVTGTYLQVAIYIHWIVFNLIYWAAIQLCLFYNDMLKCSYWIVLDCCRLQKKNKPVDLVFFVAHISNQWIIVAHSIRNTWKKIKRTIQIVATCKMLSFERFHWIYLLSHVRMRFFTMSYGFEFNYLTVNRPNNSSNRLLFEFVKNEEKNPRWWNIPDTNDVMCNFWNWVS